MWKLESDIAFCPNRFPARGVGKSTLEGAGSWIVAYQEETLKKYKVPLGPIRRKRHQKFLSLELLSDKYGFDQPSELCSVDIAGNDLDGVNESGLETFTNVAYVNAAENSLPLETFKHFPGLRELELPVNGINNVNICVTDFKTLQVLDLSFNNLTSTSLPLFGVIPHLRVLSLTGNRLKSLPVDLSLSQNKNNMDADQTKQFAKLEVLYLDDNLLSNPQLFHSLAPLPNLQELYLDNNSIPSIPHFQLIGGKAVPQSDTLKIADNKPVKINHDDCEAITESEEGERVQVNSPASAIAVVESLTTPRTENDDNTMANESTDFQPPFQYLRRLSMSNNKIIQEKDVLAVAAWPMLKHLDLHGNPLVEKIRGDPPLLATYLQERCGISIQRHNTKEKKRHIQMTQNKNRYVKEKVPKVPKQSVDLLIKAYRRNQPLPINSTEEEEEYSYYPEEYDGETEELGTIQQQSDPVFLTQVDDDGREDACTPPKEESRSTPDLSDYIKEPVEEKPIDPKYQGYEILLDTKPDETFEEPIGLQNNVKALRMMLEHERVYRSSAVVLDRRQSVYEPKASKTWQKMQVSRKPAVPLTKKEQLDLCLDKIKNETNAVVTMKLTEAFNSTKITHKEAMELLDEVQDRYKGLDMRKIKSRSAKRSSLS